VALILALTALKLKYIVIMLAATEIAIGEKCSISLRYAAETPTVARIEQALVMMPASAARMVADCIGVMGSSWFRGMAQVIGWSKWTQ
jgi:hypothetical protein